ncbi:sigma-54 dependent transcriptional regulator [uncultured Desulfosarcina sp.]|uniref:sigma-54-dependent transcriptional regulator n=1 Tax=uncultured Desulfosarcina sp. TaxID=218289 RepID=UPI0029C7284A|nr:sigma-54 dependent transcriptional regulator [uncultured Desulfosarcina sp.]
MSKTRIMVVDDELIIRESLAGWLERDGHHVETADSGEAALKKLTSEQFDIMLVDIKMEGMSGLDLLRVINEQGLDTAVVMITAYGSISTAIDAMKSGAVEYLLKPFDPEEIGVLIEKIISQQAQEKENLYLREEVKARTRFESMIGQSAAMQQVFDLIRDIAPTDSTILITGETGTGKGLAAKAIHTSSRRSQGPFVAVNCGAIPEHLMESELFGHQKGAFTDARETKKGRLELANGGTLFLDEIGEISMRMQIDLLRVLEDRVFYRVGGTQPLEADFRVIAATNRDLKEAIAEGSFREDLFYRLNVIAFAMPPLSHRKEDIPLLCDHFLRRFAQETNKPIRQVSREAMDEMMLYDWPGNIRELENAIERAVVVGKGPRVMAEDLPIVCGLKSDEPADHSLKAIEKSHIHQVLKENDWNISICAKILGIDRSTLYSKIKRYRLQSPS